MSLKVHFFMDLYTFYLGKVTTCCRINDINLNNTLRELKIKWLNVMYPQYMTNRTNIDYCVNKVEIWIWNTNKYYEGNDKTLSELGITYQTHLSVISSLR